MTVRVILTLYQKSWELSRQRILDIIPDSLLAQALQTEPDVGEIQLENPDVTPEALNIITDLLQGKEPPHHIPNLSSSARYLNLPCLLYYEDPLYDQVDKRGNYDTCKNRELMNEAVRTGRHAILEYLLLKGVIPLTDMKVGVVISQPLNMAINVDNLKAFQILLADPRVKEEYSYLTLMRILFPPRYRLSLSKIQDYFLRTIPASVLFSLIRSEEMYSLINEQDIPRIYPRAETCEQKDLLITMSININTHKVKWWLLEQPGNTNFYLKIAAELSIR